MRVYCGRALVPILVLVGMALATAGLADAKSKPKISPVDRTSKGAKALAKAMAVDPNTIINAKFVAVPPDHHPVAISTKPLAAFPRSGKSYAILTNGESRYADRAGSKILGFNDAGVRIRGAKDVTIIRVKVRVPKHANCLSFRFRFLSQEFPEFVGSPYNDAFIAELDHSTWDAGTTLKPKVTAPRDFARDRDGKVVSINATGVDRMGAQAAKGTFYGGATRVLRASTPIGSGSHFLYLSIFDHSDKDFDSAAFIDQLTINRRSPCSSGLAKTT